MKCIQAVMLAISLAFCIMAAGQDFSKTMHEIEKVKAAYKAAGYLSYQMKYLYSKESAPAKYLDSLIGNFKTHDSSFFGKIGKIEFLQNAVANVSVYNQDKLMMLNKLVRQEDKVMPLANWDSMFVAFNMDTTHITDRGSTRTLEFIFAPAANYKKFLIQYDFKTYLLKKIVMTTKQSPVDNGPGKLVQDGNMVTVLFSGYSTVAFDTAIFSETRYVQLQGEQPIAMAAYNGFRVVDLRNKTVK